MTEETIGQRLAALHLALSNVPLHEQASNLDPYLLASFQDVLKWFQIHRSGDFVPQNRSTSSQTTIQDVYGAVLSGSFQGPVQIGISVAELLQIIDKLLMLRDSKKDTAPSSAIQAMNKHGLGVQLRDLIAQHFNRSDLAELCFNLGIDSEDIPGETLLTRSRELVQYCERRSMLQALLAQCKHERPLVVWPSVE